MLTLRGFLNPFDDYPAVVVPVWAQPDGSAVGVFSADERCGHGRRKLCPLVGWDDVVPLPADWTDGTVGADPLDACLLALDRTTVIGYTIEGESRTIRALLADPSFAADRPFTRLAMAKLTGAPHLLFSELFACAFVLLIQETASKPGGAKVRIEAWLRRESASIADYLGENSEAKTFVSELPATFDDLANITWWRRRVSFKPASSPLPLDVIENRTPSPKTIAVLNLVPVVPGPAMLRIMGRHLSAGTNYIFFHAPSASAEALEQLNAATLKALEQAIVSTRGRLENFASPTVGTVRFYSLEREWTGSPFVFYEEAADSGTRVIGYRGLDVGASIAQSYEQVDDQVASELLEALSSNRPSLYGFENKVTGTTGPIDFNVEKERRRA
jgi:hypothetical protein